jgi:hypothetical protein
MMAARRHILNNRSPDHGRLWANYNIDAVGHSDVTTGLRFHPDATGADAWRESQRETRWQGSGF